MKKIVLITAIMSMLIGLPVAVLADNVQDQSNAKIHKKKPHAAKKKAPKKKAEATAPAPSDTESKPRPGMCFSCTN